MKEAVGPKSLRSEMDNVSVEEADALLISESQSRGSDVGKMSQTAIRVYRRRAGVREGGVWWV